MLGRDPRANKNYDYVRAQITDGAYVETKRSLPIKK